MRPSVNGGVPTFTGASIDRAALLRQDPERVAALLAAPDARVVAALGDLVALDGERLARHPLRAAGPPAATEPILLGVEDGAPLFAVDLEALSPADRADVMPSGELVSMRDAGGRLAQAEGGLAAYLVALLNWHRRHGFCPNCGGTTTMIEGGLARRCDVCGLSHFPRTDPVVIMRVEHDGRLLLGRRVGWPPGRYSLLAGFVASGETPEEAVVREVAEESGIVAHSPRYVTSQPWPFPASLMLGFEASSAGGDPSLGDGELEDVGWFTREQVIAARSWQEDGDGLRLPPPISIARVLIDGWLADHHGGADGGGELG